jgi:hypothetical protein
MKFVAMMEMERNHLARETMVQDEGCKGPPLCAVALQINCRSRGVERRRFISCEICLSSLLSRI